MRIKTTDRASPVAVSKSMPVLIISLARSCLFCVLRVAVYFVIAEFTPQSLNRIIMYDGIKAIAYNPYSSGVISLARIIVPTAMIIVDAATPMKS